MTLDAAILTVLLAFKPYTGDGESLEARRARLTPVAHHIAEASKGSVTMAAVSITLGHSESRFAVYVGEDRCMDGPVGQQCDATKGKPRARSYWQLWRVACQKAWQYPSPSTEGLRAATACAVARFRGGMSRCATEGIGGLRGGFAGYRSADCTWGGAKSRAVKAARVESRLRAAMAR